MRLKALLYGDIRFQFKYGIHFLYFIFSVIYIGLIFILPESIRIKAGMIMIFTDPAAIGLYFMGAIILFEKNERVLDSIAVSPVKPDEYVTSKLLSIAVISTAVGLIVGLFSKCIINIFIFIISVFLCSCIFSSIGLIIASYVKTLNQFIIITVLPELIIIIPAFIYLFKYKKSFLLFHPGVCMIELFSNKQMPILLILILFIWAAFFYKLACHFINKMFLMVGGVKL